MKKLCIISLLVLSVYACQYEEKSSIQYTVIKKGSIEERIKNIPDHQLTVITHEGCEYLIYKEEKDQNSAFGFMAHKGNCKNPIHYPTPDSLSAKE